MKKEREKTFDIMKCFAIFAVVVTHVSGDIWYGYLDGETFDINGFVQSSIWLGVAKYGVPVFLMISGALLLRKTYATKDVAKKATMTVGSLVFLLVVYYIVEAIVETRNFGIVFQKVAKGLVMGTGPIYYWYLYVLFGIYLILPFLKVLVDGITRGQYIYLLCLIFLSTAALPLVLLVVPYDISTLIKMLEMGLQNMSGYVGYFLLGYYLEKYEEKNGKWFIYLMGMIGIYTAVYLGCHQAEFMEEYMSYTMPGVVMYGAMMYLLLRRSARFLANTKLASVLSSVGQKTLGIYIIHMPVLMVLYSLGFNPGDMLPAVSIPIASVIVLVISYILVSGMRLIPGVRRLI